MTLKEARGAYDYFSGKLSDVVRQLSFAGIAVIWIFKNGTSVVPFDERLVWPLRFLVSALACDLLHYAYSALAWGRFAHLHDKNGVKDSEEVSPDEKINWTYWCFSGRRFFFAWSHMRFC